MNVQSQNANTDKLFDNFLRLASNAPREDNANANFHAGDYFVIIVDIVNRR